MTAASAALATALAVLGLPAGNAAAQKLPPSAAELAASAMPVRVVCMADSPEAFVRDSWFRDHVLAPLAERGADGQPELRSPIRPLGVRYHVALGSGFVVDAERRHVVTSWQVVSACTGERGSGRQVAVLEPGNAHGSPLAAEHLPDRPFTDASGQPVLLVQALCRERSVACDADLPRAAGDKSPLGAERRRQLDNLLTYAPDLAVLRLAATATTPPLALALNQQLDDQMRLYVRGFGRGAEALLPASVPALYTGPQQFSSRAAEGSAEAPVHARLHRLAMPVQPGAGGAPVLRGDGVVGVLSVMMDVPPSSADASGLGTSHAVPVTVLASFLTLLKVPYVPAALELPQRVGDAPAGPAAPAPVAGPAAAPGGTDTRRWMLVAGALLALAAAGTFFALARRQRQAAAAPSAPAPAVPLATVARVPQPGTTRTVTRRNATVLHAVAMPTAALDSAPGQLSVHLHGSAGPLAGSVFTLPMPNGGCTLYVGRDPKSCQVVFPASMDQVSAVHACFTWDPPVRVLSLRDLSSSGTWVNGQRVDKSRSTTLGHGDRVELGGPDLNRFTIEIPPAGDEGAPE